jgi:RNA polymerase sigma-70 factor, ECF subfamily
MPRRGRPPEIVIEPEHKQFTAVYEAHVWRVYGFFAYRVKDRQTAEDLTQATFERALRAWGRFDRARGSQAAWLLAIARNLLIDHLRRGGAVVEEPIAERTEPTVAGPEETTMWSGSLTEALAQLTDRDREVVALRFGADLPGDEIARLTGLSVDNVHQVTSRSLRKLRTLLEQSEWARPQ